MTVTPEMVSHIFRYGGKCRECGDNLNVCAKSGLSCDPDEAAETIRFVLEARDHYLSQASPPPQTERTELDRYKSTICQCVTAQRYKPSCPVHGNAPPPQIERLLSDGRANNPWPPYSDENGTWNDGFTTAWEIARAALSSCRIGGDEQ